MALEICAMLLYTAIEKWCAQILLLSSLPPTCLSPTRSVYGPSFSSGERQELRRHCRGADPEQCGRSLRGGRECGRRAGSSERAGSGRAEGAGGGGRLRWGATGCTDATQAPRRSRCLRGSSSCEFHRLMALFLLNTLSKLSVGVL